MKKKGYPSSFDPAVNVTETSKRVGYIPRKKATAATYETLGFKSGLEIHQQLRTDKKLFCRCPAGVYQKEGYFDAELIRHMRPTLSELGEYDGTALMEFKTKKNITYRIANVTTCTYDVDDTPPFKINTQALEIALEIALLLNTNIVGELHITRKQYLDGSIPAGFQRTAIVGIEGSTAVNDKTVRIIQLSIEEDSCREISDRGHERIYTTDRLGIPLIEIVTYPELKTPDEVAQTAQHLRFLTRSTGKVRTGIGAGRQDVNVSIHGGTRIEIKGVAHISLIPELTHNEAFRQKSLLEISGELKKRVPDKNEWSITHAVVDAASLNTSSSIIREAIENKNILVAVNLPSFRGILSFFSQPGRTFSDEISDRLKVIACIEKPNMLHSEELQYSTEHDDFNHIRDLLNSSDNDAQILFWGPQEDIATALETIEERCKMAFDGVPNETRKALPSGITIFERVLPGPDRMYPDTDSAPIPIEQNLIDHISATLPLDLAQRIKQLRQWNVPDDTFTYLLRNNLISIIERIAADFTIEPKFIATLLAHRLKNLQGCTHPPQSFNYEKMYQVFAFIKERELEKEIILDMLPLLYRYPESEFDQLLKKMNFSVRDHKSILAQIPQLYEEFARINTSKDTQAAVRWIMKRLRSSAIGNISLSQLAIDVEKGGNHE